MTQAEAKRIITAALRAAQAEGVLVSAIDVLPDQTIRVHIGADREDDEPLANRW